MMQEVSAPEPSDDVRTRVVIVDDNTAGAETLAMLLDMLGYECEVAHTGKTAIEACHRAPPRVVLLDLCLPDMSGFTVAQDLRSSPDTKDARIIALSGTSPDRESPEHEGNFDYRLTKPVSIEALEDLLKKTAASPQM
jgi:CheY-like chemotaxis protein